MEFAKLHKAGDICQYRSLSSLLKFREGAPSKNLKCVCPFGDSHLVVFDKSPHFDCWSSEPVITFYSDKEEPNMYPCTPLPETRHFLGACADLSHRRIIAANFAYHDDKTVGKTVNLYVYNVNADYTCTLVHTFANSADECAGSGFCGRLTSLDNKVFAVTYNDTANNDHTTVFTVAMDQEGNFQQKATTLDNSVMHQIGTLEEVCFVDERSVYAAEAQRLHKSFPTLTLLVTKFSLDEDGSLSDCASVAELKILLPFPLGPEIQQQLDAQVLRVQRVEVPRNKKTAAEKQAGEGLAEEESEAEMETEMNMVLRCLVRIELAAEGEHAWKVLLVLLDLDTQCVVDMAVQNKPYGQVFMARDGGSIVRCVRSRVQG